LVLQATDLNEDCPVKMPYRIVHISDLHFWRIPANPALWYGKRFLGLANLILRRGRKFRLEGVPRLLQEIESDQPQHLIVSGDLSTTSLPVEFEDFTRAFAGWLKDPSRITILPGNHDRYTRSTVRDHVFDRTFGLHCDQGNFPFHKALAPGLHLVGFDPCQPNPISARGRVREEGVSRLASLLAQVQQSGAKALLFACHYPAEVPPMHRDHETGHELLEAELLVEALSSVSMPIYWLHGHIHYPWKYRSPELPQLTYLNPGAPLLRREKGYALGRWVLDWDGESLQTEWRSLPEAREYLLAE
jgi:3',5'-cyclic AMP phosphodiesterase CpdA